MSEETYQGWKNRETWAFNLHWSNDQGLYEMVLENARGYLAETYGDDWAKLPEDELRGAFWGVGKATIDYIRGFITDYESEYGSPLPDGLRVYRDEVRSWWRIDETEIGASVRESLK